MSNTIFLTGFPGFIASRLLRRIAQDDWRFIILVQQALREKAAQEIDDLCRRIPRNIRDFRIVSGDITAPNLGLSAGELSIVRAETTHVFHLAAIYDLAVAQSVAMQVNVQGTRHVNELVYKFPKLSHYHYVSTCYVAGKRKGVIRETELQHEAGFRNHYEETKYLAELEVEKLKADLPITIHRPAVVCGDSTTGETAKYDGVYYLIHYLLKSPGLLSLLNIGNDEVRLNLVPVDFVINSLAALADEPKVLGKTLQLADPAPLTTRELFNTISESISGRRALITVPARLVEFTLMLPPSPKITGLPHYAVPYFFLKQLYDSSEAQQQLGDHRIICPSFASYVDNIVAFAAKHPVV